MLSIEVNIRFTNPTKTSVVFIIPHLRFLCLLKHDLGTCFLLDTNSKFLFNYHNHRQVPSDYFYTITGKDKRVIPYQFAKVRTLPPRNWPKFGMWVVFVV